MGDIGIIAENEKYARGKEAAGDMAMIMEKEFHAVLEHYCDPAFYINGADDTVADKAGRSNASSHTHQALIGLVSPAQFRERNLEPPDWLIDRGMFLTLQQQPSENSMIGPELDSSATAWSLEFSRADSLDSAKSAVVTGLMHKLARSLSVAGDEIDLRRPVASLGVDSLLAIELRNWFSRMFKADLAVFDITGAASLEDLAGLVADRSTALSAKFSGKV